MSECRLGKLNSWVSSPKIRLDTLAVLDDLDEECAKIMTVTKIKRPNEESDDDLMTMPKI